ncbi:MAG: hypothetical protein WD894_02920 [Pirellulales bacterium]
MKFAIDLFKFTPTDVDSGYGWTYVEDSRAYGSDYLRCSAGDAVDAYMGLTLPASTVSRTYEVYATWVSGEFNLTTAEFRVENSSGAVLLTKTFNQRMNPPDWQDSTGRWWGLIGTITNPPGSFVAVRVAGVAPAIANAARLIEVTA